MSLDDYRQILDVLQEATLIVSGGGLILIVNPAAARLLGVTGDERRLSDVVADPAEAVAAYLRACSRSKQQVIGALELKVGERRRCRTEGVVLRPRVGGEEALILVRLTTREESVGRFILFNQRIDELNREVARRRRVEEELRAQREWLQVTLASIGDAVITTDVKGAVTFLNPRAEALTGWNLAEGVGRPLEEVFHIINEYTRAVVSNPVSQVIERGEIVGLANHTVLIAQDGTEKAIEDTAAPIRGTDGDLQGVVLVFHDIGDRRVLERQLRERAEKLAEADRRKDEFLAMLAHELRNPLAPVSNGLHILRLKAGDALVVERMREMMERQIGHLVRMVDDLMDVSRITRGKILLRLEPLDLTRTARLTADDYQPRIAAAGLTLALDLPATAVWISADPTRLTQILSNLLENAIKFSDPGGSITLEVAVTPNGGAEVRIRDAGIGIEPRLLPHIFDAFTQADRTLDRSRGGLGLGLAMVKGLVELHGGSVLAASEGPGRGTVVTVRLRRSDDLGTSGEAPDGPAASARRYRVLIVDDNRDAAESLQMVLDLSGYETGVAYNGPEGVTTALRMRPDIVLCDIGLPGMDGFAVARALRGHPETASVRLVAVTGYGEDNIRRRALEAGFDAHLVKPVESSTLLATVRPPEGIRSKRGLSP